MVEETVDAVSGEAEDTLDIASSFVFSETRTVVSEVDADEVSVSPAGAALVVSDSNGDVFTGPAADDVDSVVTSVSLVVVVVSASVASVVCEILEVVSVVFNSVGGEAVF